MSTYIGTDIKTKNLHKKGKTAVILRWFLLCPLRHSVLLLLTVTLVLYFFLRENKELMTAFTANLVEPYHRFAGQISSRVNFSITEILYVIFLVSLLTYITYIVVKTIICKDKALRIYRGFITLLTAALFVFTGFCILWGTMFYGEDFVDKSGISTELVGTDDLYKTAQFFAEIANISGEEIKRDESGLFAVPVDEIIDRSNSVYENISADFPFLKAPSLRPKPMIFSSVMSYINFTGFFFPLTGEANIDINSPRCLIPATIAHEMAHQRGIAPEQEANFLAVLACVSSSDPVYVYSGALLAYIHLTNALQSTDPLLVMELDKSLSGAVVSDLRHNNEYWESFDTKAAETSEAIYSGLLTQNGQELGIKSYGACTDLLVAYFSPSISG